MLLINSLKLNPLILYSHIFDCLYSSFPARNILRLFPTYNFFPHKIVMMIPRSSHFISLFDVQNFMKQKSMKRLINFKEKTCMQLFIIAFLKNALNQIITERFIYYRKFILHITQPSQYRCTQLQYSFAVISEAPSIL